MVFGSLALYTLAWKYAFDFYYNVAVEMDRTGQKYIEDVELKYSLFCGPVGLISELPPQYTGGIIHTDKSDDSYPRKVCIIISGLIRNG